MWYNRRQVEKLDHRRKVLQIAAKQTRYENDLEGFTRLMETVDYMHSNTKQFTHVEREEGSNYKQHIYPGVA